MRTLAYQGSNDVRMPTVPELLEHIGNSRLRPEVIVSHHLKLADAVRGYEMFDKEQDDCRKVILTP